MTHLLQVNLIMKKKDITIVKGVAKRTRITTKKMRAEEALTFISTKSSEVEGQIEASLLIGSIINLY